MSIEDELRREVQGRPPGGRTLGEAANRWVTWQIVTSINGLVVFLLFFFLIILPSFNAFFRFW
jgi:hypothetical protein